MKNDDPRKRYIPQNLSQTERDERFIPQLSTGNPNQFEKILHQYGWNLKYRNDPTHVYQLGLRIGLTYFEICDKLFETNHIDSQTYETLSHTDLISIKQNILRDYQLNDWAKDIWVITEDDNGLIVQGIRSSLVVIRLTEHASSGYLWHFTDLVQTGLIILQADRFHSDSRANQIGIGGLLFRNFITEIVASGHVELRESRPWQRNVDPLNQLEFDIVLPDSGLSGSEIQVRKKGLLGVE